LLFGGRIELEPTPDSVLVLLVLLAGSIGAYIHVATSFAEFVGVRSFARSWFWWYMLRLPIGAALAVILYFALRGGLLAADGDSNAVNPYGVGALAALAGLFSKQAADKLSEVFDTAFRTREGYGDDRRSDTRVHPFPTLKHLSPKDIPAAQDSELVLAGSGFVDASAVLIKPSDPGNPTPALLRSDKVRFAENDLVIRLAARELAPGDYAVSVVTEAPGGGVSEAKPLQVT
jgi:hypothetical protein